MSDETGKPDEELVEESIEEPLDESTPAPEEEEKPSAEPEPTIRERFKDKSNEELLDILEETQRELGQKGTDVGDLRARIDSLESSQSKVGVEEGPLDDSYTFKPKIGPVAGGQTPIGPGPPSTSGVPPGMDPSKLEWDYEKPVESTQKVVAGMMAAQSMGQTMKEHNTNISRAKSAFDRGSKIAIANNKKLFSGIEKQAKDFVYNYYNDNFLQQGVPVDDVLITEEPYVKAAQNIRIENQEFDKLQADKPTPVSPAITEHPSGAYPAPGKGEKRNLKLDYNDDEVRRIMKDYGEPGKPLTRKQAEEIIAETQEAIEKGEFKL